jgi:hypothetical protein
VHRPGVMNVIPNALSRLFEDQDRPAGQRDIINNPIKGGHRFRLVGGKDAAAGGQGQGGNQNLNNKPKAYLESVNTVQVGARADANREEYTV